MKKLEIKHFETRTSEDKYEIHNLVKKAIQSKERVWAWQYKLIDVDERVTANALVKRLNHEKESFEIRPYGQTSFVFEPSGEVVLFFENQSILFRSQSLYMDHETITLEIPRKIAIMKEDFIDELEFFEKEDELKFKGYRKAPRIQAKSQKVTLRKATDPFKKPHVHHLYDISKNGLGIKLKDPTEFDKGEKVVIEVIDDKPLTPELKGRVVSIRQMAKDDFKLGVQFDVHPYQKESP